ncbi:hypothetical protein PMI36_01345 [Pseudomonas sp. GM79]|jgi:hypothetical protein|uniref:hypothetical protein n=1 Tax=Pseudomonas sp. GM79 TaxID=1144338 RepID=UPI00026FC9BD|nr:hypothetical protein [Pseudomonas sp. GM79]EJN26249.1 hypothetical protein PMI36_01345 [Pseudomonas sp. GM79]
MSFRRWIDGWRFILLMVLAVTLLRWWIDSTLDDFEVSLNINEPWEDMLQRSNAAIGPIPSGKVWSNKSRSGVCLRFNDPDYGFVTPLARYFTITSKNGRVGRVRLSPQIEPLPLDDALKVVLGLHDQWREKGWVAAKVLDDPVIADTPEWRAWLRDGTGYAMSFWLAGDKYQLKLDLEPSNRSRHRTDQRYLIFVTLAEPWLPFENAEHARIQDHPITSLFPSKSDGAPPCQLPPS